MGRHFLGRVEPFRVLRPLTFMVSNRSERQQLVIAEDVHNAISGTLHLTFKTAALHLIFTWLAYDLFNVSGGLGACLWAVLAAGVALLGLAPAALLCIPGTLELWIYGSPVAAMWFFALHWVVLSRLGLVLLKEVRWRKVEGENDDTTSAAQFHSSPFLIGLAVCT